jgi:hypothetical protein
MNLNINQNYSTTTIEDAIERQKIYEKCVTDKEVTYNSMQIYKGAKEGSYNLDQELQESPWYFRGITGGITAVIPSASWYSYYNGFTQKVSKFVLKEIIRQKEEDSIKNADKCSLILTVAASVASPGVGHRFACNAAKSIYDKLGLEKKHVFEALNECYGNHETITNNFLRPGHEFTFQEKMYVTNNCLWHHEKEEHSEEFNEVSFVAIRLAKALIDKDIEILDGNHKKSDLMKKFSEKVDNICKPIIEGCLKNLDDMYNVGWSKEKKYFRDDFRRDLSRKFGPHGEEEIDLKEDWRKFLKKRIQGRFSLDGKIAVPIPESQIVHQDQLEIGIEGLRVKFKYDEDKKIEE